MAPDTTKTQKSTKPNLFAKAATKTASTPTTKKRAETIWAISPPTNDVSVETLNLAVSEMHRLHAERKRLETEESIHKNALKGYAEDRYVDHVAKTGAEPESPLKIINDKHQTITFVVQDRGHLTTVTDGHIQALNDVLGADAAASLVYETMEFKFDDMTMSQEAPDGGTVQDLVAEAISDTLNKLVEKGKLRQEQMDNLLTCQLTRKFRPSLLQHGLAACGRNAAKLSGLLAALGGAIVRYVKP